MYTRLKKSIYKTIEPEAEQNKPGHFFNLFIIILITLNVIAVILESVKWLAVPYETFFYNFELISVLIFTVEYLSRVWTCTENPKFSHPVKGRIKYAFSFLALTDLIAILPYYLPFLFPVDMRFVRAFRLLRIFRLLKLARYTCALSILSRGVTRHKDIFGIIFFILTILLIISSSIMYFFESTAQPHLFSSIPMTMWWAIATVTTVGYGDVYPVTMMGKLFGSIIALIAIGIFALPAGVLASAFMEEFNHMKNCPEPLDEDNAKKIMDKLEHMVKLRNKDILNDEEIVDIIRRTLK